MKYPEIFRKNMKIPDDEDIFIGIALGYKDDENIFKQNPPKKINFR